MKDFLFQKQHNFSFLINELDEQEYLLLYKEFCLNKTDKMYCEVFDLFENCNKKFSIKNKYNEENIGLIGICSNNKKIYLFNKTYTEIDFKDLLHILE